MDEREAWLRYVGPDYDTDEMYGLQCPECDEPIEEGEEVWYQRVAFCKTCLPRFKAKHKLEARPEPSEALKRIRKHLHALR